MKLISDVYFAMQKMQLLHRNIVSASESRAILETHPRLKVRSVSSLTQYVSPEDRFYVFFLVHHSYLELASVMPVAFGCILQPYGFQTNIMQKTAHLSYELNNKAPFLSFKIEIERKLSIK